jgi:hypothetical protein
MTWVNLSAAFGFGTQLTSLQMQNLRDNITAQANGDAGSPQQQTAGIADNAITLAKLANDSVSQAEIAAAAVGQSELKSATETYSSASPFTATFVNFTYGFGWAFYNSGTNATGVKDYNDGTGTITGAIYNNTTSAALKIEVQFGVGTGYAQMRYVQASPPYDEGDGEIATYVFGLITPNGEIAMLWSAPDAPWHNNGPTNCRGKRNKEGVYYRRMRAIEAQMLESGKSLRQMIAESDIRELAERFATDDMVDMEITQAIKMRDRELLPHPWLGQPLNGNTVVLLDPVCDELHKLYAMERVEPGIIHELIHEGKIHIGNDDLPRSKPPGVMCVSLRY